MKHSHWSHHLWLVSLLLMVSSPGEGQDFSEAAAPAEGGASGASLGRSYAQWVWHDAPIRAVFQELSKIGRVDIVCSDAVVGNVTLNLSNKTWKEAFNVICRVRKLAVLADNDYLYVMTHDEFKAEQLNNASTNQAVEQLAPLRREVIRMNNLAAAEVVKSIETLLSQRGKITVAEHNNCIIVYDTDNNIGQIRDMVRKLDVETQQISISAKILEVGSGALQNLGVQWGLFANNLGGQNFTAEHLPSASGTSTQGAGQAPGAASTTSKVLASALERLTWGIIGQDRLAFTLEYLYNNSKAEVVAQPTITTLDNKQARIFMGGRIPLLWKDEAGNNLVKYEQAGTELTVTPHVTDANRVMLQLEAKKESVGAGGAINSQNATTTVVVNNGETVVIAGLTSNEMEEGDEGIPILKDIPVIGHLFKRSRKTVNKKDLIIFVTPHIVQKDIEAVSAEAEKK